MTIYIDADACPVTRIAETIAKKHGFGLQSWVKGTRIDSAAGQLYTLTEYFRGFVKKRAAA